MRSLILTSLFASIAGAGCSGAPTADRETLAQSPMAIPVQLSATFPRTGVDHIVTYAFWRSWGPRAGDRAVVVRHGNLVRMETRLIATRRSGESEIETSFANIDTGASLSVTRDAQGRLAGVSIWQGERAEAKLPMFRTRLVRTGETEEIAGERCRVWRAEPETDEGGGYSACISADGVLLRDTVLYRDGRAMSERRALSVERRPVAPVEVLPPREALDWAYWANATAARVDANHAVELVARGEGLETRRLILLADGVFESEEQRLDDTVTSLGVIGAGGQLSYHGRTPQLSISRATASSSSSPNTIFESTPMANRPPERVLGEPCRWIDTTVGVADYSRVECRTTDGLTLIIEERSRGSSTRWEAVSLSRGRTPPGRARPPANLMSWSRWGWPMLDRD